MSHFASKFKNNNRAAMMEQHVVKKIFAAVLAATCSLGVSAANVAPTVAITAPAANASFVAPAGVSLSATAADSDGSVASVAFYNGATLLGTVTAAPYTYSWTNVAAGTYSVTTKATDDLGLVTTSAPLTVTVKANVLPTIALTKPIANASYAAPGSVALAVTTADSDGTVVKVAYLKDGTQIASSTSAPFALTWTNVAVGSYSMQAKAYDDKGGVTVSAAVPIVVKANVAPTVSVSTSATAANLVGPGATVPLNATAADSDGTVAKVDFYNGTVLIGTDTTAPFSFNWTGVAIGTYSITAKATDDKGVATTSAPISVTVNANVAPTVSITSPATFYVPGTATLSVNAADSDGTIAKVVYYNGATVIGTATTAPFSYAWANPAAGSYSITAQATDNKGAVTASAAQALTVKTVPVPTVSVTAPTQNARFAGPAAFTLTASAAITGDTIKKVEYISSGSLVGTATAAPYAINLSNVAVGNYVVTAKATGNLGGTATSSVTNLAVVSDVAPQVSLTTSQSSGTAPAVITLNAVATDADGTIAKVEFYNGATLLGTATQAPFSYTWSGVAAGSYAVTANAIDNLGLAATSAVSTVTIAAAVADTAKVYFIHSDQINTAREITNVAGVKVWTADAEPFGANLPNENPAGQGNFTYNPRFPGQYYDRETGLHYNYFRDYDPQTGRYIESDPIGLAGGMNTYTYVLSQPTRYVDKNGLDIGDCPGGMVAQNRPNGPVCVSDPSAQDKAECVTAECAAGILPNNNERLLTPEQKCEIVCDLVVASPCKYGAVSAPGGIVGKAAVYLTCNYAVHKVCQKVCKPKDKVCEPGAK